jgi:tetratricopeptide (TPR) repeat protein
VEPDPPLAPENEGESWALETRVLLAQKRYAEALDRVSQRLKVEPSHPGVVGLMGQCLWHLGRHEESVAYFKKASELDETRRPSWGVWIGLAFQKMGHSAEALPLLQKETPVALLDRMRQESLLECLIDLERFDEALRMLDPAATSGGHLHARHRILCYQGKPEEARKLLEGADAHQKGTLVASELRESGQFEAAFKEIDAIKAGSQPTSVQWMRGSRSELAVCVESGDLTRLERAAADLQGSSDPQPRGSALLYRIFGRLMQGKMDEARVLGKEFLASTDATYTPLRLERMMMRHLLGELKTEDLDVEAKKVSRFLANDLYWYLALATGDKAWAKKAADATPGRNFPYHAIQRLLKE